jgi:hypothetical protein
MSQLLQFSLLDMTPYDRQSWFYLVGDYNQAIWLAYPLALLLTLAMLGLLFRPTKKLSDHQSVRWVLAFLGAGWIWTGAVFHTQYFADLNWAAPWFGWAFIAQGCLLLLAAILMKSASWVPLSSLRGRLAQFLLLLGLVIYPLSGLLEGRTFMQLEWFPLLPAPVTLVSFALLMLLTTRWRHALVVIPILWSVVSAAFATTLGLLEFYFMAGAIILWVMHLALGFPNRISS